MSFLKRYLSNKINIIELLKKNNIFIDMAILNAIAKDLDDFDKSLEVGEEFNIQDIYEFSLTNLAKNNLLKKVNPETIIEALDVVIAYLCNEEIVEKPKKKNTPKKALKIPIQPSRTELAIVKEDGIDFYTDCRKNIRNARGIELFEFLIKVEHGHKTLLTDLLDAISKGDSAKKKKSMDDFMALDTHTLLFDERSLERMKSKDTLIIDILNKAIDFEVQGVAMYENFIGQTNDPELKKLFRRLADDEKGHRKDLIALGHFVFGMPEPSTLGEQYENI